MIGRGGTRVSDPYPLPGLLVAKRGAAGINMRTAAKAAGVSTSTVCRVEAGKQPDVVSALLLASWLGISVEYAMTGRDNATSRCGRCVHRDSIIDRALDLLAKIAPRQSQARRPA